MTKQRIRAVLFGPQGSGKGTQGELLADRFDVPLIGAGEILRAEIASKSHLGNILKEYVDNGLLAPDEIVNAVVSERLKKLDLSKGFILDGFPRNVDQAMQLDRAIKINLAICIKISDTESVRRLVGRLRCTRCKAIYHQTDAPPAKPGVCSICGGKLAVRADDTPDVIRRRLTAFHYMTEPLLTYYRSRGVLLMVNGEQSIPYVFEDLIKKMQKLKFQS